MLNLERESDWDAASSTSERVERAENGVGKKYKSMQKYLNVTSDDLWRIRTNWDGKKSSLGKTDKMNREANDKVYDVNQQASKYLDTLTLLYSNFLSRSAQRRRSKINLIGTLTSR